MGEYIHGHNIGRQILYMDEYQSVKKLRETLLEYNVDPLEFLRVIPLSHIVKDFEKGIMRSEIPALKVLYPEIKETVSIDPALAQLKTADLVIEGAEPYSFWKQMWRIENMDSPKLNIPIAGADEIMEDLDEFKGTDGTKPTFAGGEFREVAFDTAGDKGYYRVATQIKRNWLRDNNFRAIEVHLKQLGEAWAFKTGKFLVTKHGTAADTTDTKANLDGLSNTFLEALVNVIRNKMPVSRFPPDSIIIHPADHFETITQQWGTAGPLPAIDARLLGEGTRSFGDAALASMLGLRAAWITPFATEGTVLIYRKDKAFIMGLRQDLEFEDFGDTLMGLQGSVTSMRFDQQEAWDKATFKITTFA